MSEYIVNRSRPSLKPRLPNHKFNTPQIVMTKAIEDTECITDVVLGEFLNRHFSGDWGSSQDAQVNDNCLANANNKKFPQGMLMSVYNVPDTSTIVWIITDMGWDRTTILLPEDY